MNKCVLVLGSGDLSKEHLQEFLKKAAKNAQVEGFVHIEEGTIKMVVCGDRDRVDALVDILYEKGVHYGFIPEEVEPYFKHKDLRGIFRIVKSW